MEYFAMKVLKNKRRIDPRYHLDEKREHSAQKSNSEIAEEIQKSFSGQFSFDSWLNESDKDCKPDYPDLDKDGDEDECISDAAKDAEKVDEIVGPQGPEPRLSMMIDDEEEFPGGTIADMPAEVPESPCAAKEKGSFEVASRFGILTTPDKSADSLKAASNFAMHLLHNMGLSPEEVQMSPEISAVVTESDTPESVEEELETASSDPRTVALNAALKVSYNTDLDPEEAAADILTVVEEFLSKKLGMPIELRY
tara:strand:- start:336 stop:1094 length:759 start_codon:yes stop_codon:yes gene_type:complete